MNLDFDKAQQMLGDEGIHVTVPELRKAAKQLHILISSNGMRAGEVWYLCKHLYCLLPDIHKK